ncbi:9413_t:CDS:2 [Funneliformis geosporum]|nr:9413_t:CDS:2 [Funneliformis geosporum]
MSDYNKYPCYNSENCLCGECLYSSQPSLPSSISSSDVIGSRRNSYATITTRTDSPPSSILKAPYIIARSSTIASSIKSDSSHSSISVQPSIT